MMKFFLPFDFLYAGSHHSVRIFNKVHDHLLTFFGVKMIKNKIDKMLPSINLQYTQAPTMHFLDLVLEKVISHIYLRNTRYDNHTSLVKPTKN